MKRYRSNDFQDFKNKNLDPSQGEMDIEDVELSTDNYDTLKRVYDQVKKNPGGGIDMNGINLDMSNVPSLDEISLGRLSDWRKDLQVVDLEGFEKEIDKEELFPTMPYRTVSDTKKLPGREEMTPMINYLFDMITMRGFLSVSHFMKEVLLNPLYGYYINKEALGQSGDFITSPEISQLFGEMLAVWIYDTWQKMGGEPIKLIELGPGTGALMSDILKVLEKSFPDIKGKITIHFVEVSENMRKKQAKALGFYYEDAELLSKDEDKTTEQVIKANETIEREKKRKVAAPFSNLYEDVPLADENTPSGDVKYNSKGMMVYWHQKFSSVPDGKAIIIAHELFDALPVNQFVYSDYDWRERHIDINMEDGPSYFNFVVSKRSSYGNSFLFDKYIDQELPSNPSIGDQIEISLDGIALAQEIGMYTERNGGAGLIIDYGYDHQPGFSLRAIKDHKLVDPLVSPGESDLSCMVDFNALKKSLITRNADRKLVKSEKVKYFGPVTQQDFLTEMGVNVRMANLVMKTTKENTAMDLIDSFEKLIDIDQMGNYKFLAFGNVDDIKTPPSGFLFSQKN
eukprot:TRINITY_DN6682_c0_g1_i1.p1 TRINITY_DN6682_c0_g1~~TRINITY_DN6682_c0_g1_i1.p1  ORF type:complete len:593 (+),score=162.30 TRINITY_DN6682_c0_g1_i1:75-1781(+)